jgi:broad specificity phosphatase PhoE
MPTPTWLVTSDLLRTQQTAEPIARRFGLKVQLDARLRELAMGEFTGRSWDEIYASESEAFARWGEHFITEGSPGGESYLSQQARVCAAFEEYSVRPGNGLIVTHQGALRVLFGFLQGIAPEIAVQLSFDYGGIFVVSHGPLR